MVSVPAMNIKTASAVRPMSEGVYWPFVVSGLSMVSKIDGNEVVVPFCRESFRERTCSRHCFIP